MNLLREKLALDKLIGDYIKLEEAGCYLKGECLFHDGDNLNCFIINPNKKTFYCYYCSHGGDIFSFICVLKRISMIEAVNFLAKEYNIDVDIA